MSKIEVNAIEPQCGTTLTIGASDTSIAGIGTVNWDTTAKTAGFTAVSGRGYFVNTTSAAITVTLPAGSAGSIVSLKDYANTWDTNNVTVTPNGTDKINGTNASATLSTEDQSITLVYVDSTKGWRVVQDSTSDVTGAAFVTATGGTITTCGDFKIHTFTGPGTFCVSCAGNPAGSNTVDYLVVAGGGGSGSFYGGGGGGGGFRYYANATDNPQTCAPASPINNFPSGTAVTVTATAFPITVGGGGSQVPASPGTQGNSSTFSTITSAGGGFGGGGPAGTTAGGNGGSGGGSGGPAPTCFASAGTGNTPPVSPPQGTNGGQGQGGAGGGALVAAGGPGPAAGGAGAGVTGFGTSGENCGSFYYFSGGGGGGSGATGPAAQPGGLGGGGDNFYVGCVSSPGTVNTGGGGGGDGGAGGSGIVIIRYKYQ